MDDYKDFFKGKRVTLMRIGLLGRGVGDAAFLAECGAQVLVVDDAPQEVMQPSVDALKKYDSITFKFGAYDLKDFRDCDLVLKGAGTPLNSPEIAEAKKNGIPVRMSADLFAELSGATVVGITGTRGKSTTAALIFETLKAAGKKALLGGNIKGVSTLAMLPRATPDTIAVLELDSWQLQGWGEGRISPHIAVFTTFYPDHLNYYGSTSLSADSALDAYLADKAEIFLHQKPDDTLILGEQCEKIVQEKYEGRIPSHAVVAYMDDIPHDWKLAIPGEHNRQNAACALFALRILGISEDDIRKGFERFRGVPGRLEFLREVRGIKIYNDNSSTTPEATIAALRALGDPARRRVVLIMGGDEKNLDMSGLVAEIPKWCSRVVLFKERGTQRIRSEVFALETEDLHVYEEEGITACVERAFDVAEAGDSIVYSPAFSSFGKYFKNEYDRGEQFLAIVKKLI